MKFNKRIINIDLTENEMFNKYLDQRIKSNKKAKRLAIVVVVVVLLLYVLLLLAENM